MMKWPSYGDSSLAVTPKRSRYKSRNRGNMRTIGGINSSHGKLYGQAALGVRKITWKHYHIIKSSDTVAYPLCGDFLAVPIKSAYALGFMDNVTEILDAIAEGDLHTMETTMKTVLIT